VISREQAAGIAKAEAVNRQLAFEVDKVVAPDEITWATPNLYAVSLDNCWIAYLKPVRPLGLFSSTIIVIDRSSGAIRYAGLANDEG